MPPRFLLPRLSWQPSSTNPQVFRSFSTILADNSSSSISSSNPVPWRNQRDWRQDFKAINPRSQILQTLPTRRAFHATTRQFRDHHFDTLKFVQRLKDEGFSEEQSVAMMKVLSDVIEERYLLHAPPNLDTLLTSYCIVFKT